LIAVLRPWTAVVVLTAALAGCATARGPVGGIPPPKVPPGAVQTGVASWYGERHQGRRTASGELYDMHRLTAAHGVLPLGTLVLVTNLQNGRSVEVRVNDRGPAVARRIIDLSYAAAQALGAVAAGTIPVSVRVRSTPTGAWSYCGRAPLRSERCIGEISRTSRSEGAVEN
jgi:rare lipoprotein A